MIRKNPPTVEAVMHMVQRLAKNHPNASYSLDGRVWSSYIEGKCWDPDKQEYLSGEGDLIGRAFRRLGYDLSDVEDVDLLPASGLCRHIYGDVFDRFDPEEPAYWLDVVQSYCDSGDSWGDAVTAANAELYYD